MILAELVRRGRGERILVVTPRHVLEQMQFELWTRFALPFVRLDSVGIQRIRRHQPLTAGLRAGLGGVHRVPGTRHDGEQERLPRAVLRYSTIEAAREGHADIVTGIRMGVDPWGVV